MLTHRDPCSYRLLRAFVSRLEAKGKQINLLFFPPKTKNDDGVVRKVIITSRSRNSKVLIILRPFFGVRCTASESNPSVNL